MPKWLCPKCAGGFPAHIIRSIETDNGEKKVKACPWCGQIIGRFNTDIEKVIR